MPRLLALTFLLASAVHAETYKWVDEKGVVNYSNTPPPAATKAAQTIAERVSTYETDPSLRRAIAYTVPSSYEQMLQQEWLQRQRLMAERQNVQTIYEAPPAEPVFYRTAYYYPVSTVRRVHRRPAPRFSPPTPPKGGKARELRERGVLGVPERDAVALRR